MLAIASFFECSSCPCKSDKRENSVFGRWAEKKGPNGNSSPTHTAKSNASTASGSDNNMRTQYCPDPTGKGRNLSGERTGPITATRRELPVAEASPTPAPLKRRGSIERMAALLSPRARDSQTAAPLRRKGSIERITSLLSPKSGDATANESGPVRRRGSWVPQIIANRSREASPEPQANPSLQRRGSWVQRMMGNSSATSVEEKEGPTEGSAVRTPRGRRGSLIQRMKGTSPEPQDTVEPYIGQRAKALFYYQAKSTSAPFPPDPAVELTMAPGMRLDLLNMREDGWCKVRKRPQKKEYYVPGNYITVDGQTPYFKGTTLERWERPWGLS